MATELILYCKSNSRFTPGKIGHFKRMPEFNNLHVYKGKTMSIAEFNKLPHALFSGNHSGGLDVSVQAFEVSNPAQGAELQALRDEIASLKAKLSKPAVSVKTKAKKTTAKAPSKK
jgi:hypothetical protein